MHHDCASDEIFVRSHMSSVEPRKVVVVRSLYEVVDKIVHYNLIAMMSYPSYINVTYLV